MPNKRARRHLAGSTATTTAGAAPTASALERALAIAIATLGIVAAVGFALTLAHIGLKDAVPWIAGAPWIYAFWLPALALPLAFLALIALLAVSATRKARSRA